MALPTRKRLMRRIMPDSAFWRLTLATAILGLLTALAAMAVSKWIGKQLVYSISTEAAFTVLRNTVDIIGNTQIHIQENRFSALQQSKDSLREALDFTMRAVISQPLDNISNRDNEFFSWLNTHYRQQDPAVGILAANGVVVVDATDFLAHVPGDATLDNTGASLLTQLTAAAQQLPERDIYHLLYQDQGARITLTGVRHLKNLGLTLFATTNFSKKLEALQQKRQLILNEMRARINEIVVGKSGYMLVLDQSCNMIVHPLMTGDNTIDFTLPSATRPLCDRMQETAEQPWDQNFMFYDWNTPSDIDNYIYRKIAWCTVEPTTGWTVCASSYVSEIEEPLPAFVARIFFPALGSILLLGLALAFILRSQLKPVNILSKVCQRVSHGDLNVSAPEEVSGEIGKLCWHFNSMIKRIRGLRQRDERRRFELEDLNQNLEKKVRLRTRALERKAHKLEEANIRLKELDELKTNFVSSVSHELRTPLTSILGFAKIIARDYSKLNDSCSYETSTTRKRANRIQGNLDIIVLEGERLSRLINDFLDLAKIEAGRLEWHDSLLDFQEVALDTMSSMFAQIRGKRDITVRHNISPHLPLIYADRDRLTQVLLNLMNNALKFTSSGSILLNVCQRNGILQCRVKDTGIGIMKEELLKVFDKFHQIAERDTRREKPQGTGLGLAICQNIVEHYNGIIWVESEYEKGAEFIFEIPVRADKESTPEKPNELHLHAQQLDNESAPMVLVVDDDQHIQALLLHLFEDAGYRVATASDGTTALELAKATPPDLITMDLMMPTMHGSETIDQLRNDPHLSNIPIIVVSALADTNADNHTSSNAVLSKPIDEALLLSTAHSLLLQDGSLVPNLKTISQSKEWASGYSFLCDDKGTCTYCEVEELPKRVASGFTGMIYVPRQARYLTNIAHLSGTQGIQVVML